MHYLLMACLLGFISPVQAGTLGEIKIIAELTQMYNTLNEQLQTLKTQNENIKAMKTMYQDSVETYDTVVNFRLENIERRVRRDFDSLTGLDNMEGLTLRQRLDVIKREFDRRVSDASPKARPDIEATVNRQRELLARYETMIELQEAIEVNLATSRNDIDERAAAQIQAQNASILSLLKLLEAKEQVREDLARSEDTGRLKNMQTQREGIYGAIQKSGW